MAHPEKRFGARICCGGIFRCIGQAGVEVLQGLDRDKHCREGTAHCAQNDGYGQCRETCSHAVIGKAHTRPAVLGKIEWKTSALSLPICNMLL